MEAFLMKVSIIVSVYNKSNYIVECLESISDQKYSNWECIIVNDGSTDNSEAIIKDFIIKDNRFKYLYQENAGVSIARNNGIIHSNGEFIVPLDGDDKLHFDFLEKCIKCFIEDEKLKLVTCEGEYFGSHSGNIDLPEIDLKRLPVSNMFFCTAMFRRSDFEKTHGYISNQSAGMEDWLFWIDFLKEGDKIFRIPETLFYYRIISDSKSHTWKDDSLKKLNLLDRIFLHNPQLYTGINNPIVLYREKIALEADIERINKRFFVRIDNKLRPLIVRLKQLMNRVK